MASQICNPETTTHNPTNDAKIVNTGSYKARLIASIYPSDKSVYVFKLSQVIQGISSAVRLLVYRLAKVWSLGAITLIGSAPGTFTSTSWLLILLFLSFPTQSFAGSGYEKRFFDENDANSIWENYSTPETFTKYFKKYYTPEIREAYNKWDKDLKIHFFHSITTQKSLDYLAQQPLGEEIKKLKDIWSVYNTWGDEFRTYARCVETQYRSNQPFIIFEDFQKAKAIYVNVKCNSVGIKCSEYTSEGRYEDVHHCKFFPDWRYKEDTPWVERYATYEKNGIRAVLPD